jgi:ATP-binding cassette subfamily B protein
MVAKQYGRLFSIQKLREATQIGKEGVSLLGISEAAESIGFKTLAIKVPFKQLENDAPLPCIVHWKQNHFVVVYQIKKNQVFVADPALGLIKYSCAEFESQWATTIVEGEKTGSALLLEATQRFYQETDEQTRGINLSMLSGYVFKYKRLILQLFLGLFIGSILQLILPFLTQSVVDTGIQTRNLHFIYLVLAAQLMLFIGRMSVEFIRSWILLHISTRINLSILSDFWVNSCVCLFRFLNQKKLVIFSNVSATTNVSSLSLQVHHSMCFFRCLILLFLVWCWLITTSPSLAFF